MQAFYFYLQLCYNELKVGDKMEFLWGIVVIIGFVGIYILFFALNEKTKVPEGCELPEDFQGCGACHSATCGSRKKPVKITSSDADKHHDS